MAEIKIISRVIPRGGSGASAPSGGGGFSAPVDISGKLDKSVWNSAFELHYDDPDDPEKLTSIGAKTNFFSVGEISVFGKGGSSGGGGGATTLHMLEDVDLVMPIPDGDVLTYDAERERWTNKKGAGGIDTKAMWEELGKSDISKKIDISHIPDLGDKYISLIKLGEVSYGPDKGVISLPAYPTKLSDLKDDVIAGKYLPLTGGTISGNLAVTGHVQIGNALLKYDAANNAVYVEKDDGSMVNFYATGDLAAFGSTTDSGSGATSLGMLDDVDLVTPLSEGQVLTYDSVKNKWTNKKGGGGLDIDAMWDELAKSDTSKRIHFSHIPDLGSVYAKQVKLGTTPYNVSNGVISLPAYPTALRSPNALTISLNGKSQGGYDGSSAKSINITPSSIGAALSSDLSKYVLKSGDTITGNLAVNGEIDCNVIGENVNDAHDGDSPWYGIRFTGGASGMDISGYYGIGFYTSNGRMIYLGNNQSHIVNLYAEGNANTDSSFVSSMTDRWQLQWPIYFNPDNAVFRANQLSLMMHDSCRPIISWKDTLDGVGWQTRYTIGTYRPDYDTWGTMLIAVSNDDGGNSPGIRLELEASNNRVVVQGSFLASGEITAYSDARLKSSIKPLRNRGFITPVSYIKDGKESIGFIAQDMIELYPELVAKGSTKEHYLSVNYAQYTAVLQAQIIELHKEIDDLKRKFIN